MIRLLKWLSGAPCLDSETREKLRRLGAVATSRTHVSDARRGATALLVCLALVGCGTGLSTGGVGLGAAGVRAHVTGRVHGGQQPVSGSVIRVFAVGTTGNGSAATSLMNSGVTVTTDGYGDFDLDNTYTCPTGTPNAQVYAIATGGNPGLSGTYNNTALTMLAPLGPCAPLVANAANVYISLDEVVTAATVYAWQGFMTDGTHIGAASAYATGVANGVALVNSLVSVAGGYAPGSIPGNGSVPSSEINTLATIIATCVNTGTNTSGACTNLFTATTVGSTAPVDTVTALLSIARNPATNVGGIFNLTSAVAPYQPVLTAAPKDWTLAVKYTGGGLALPTGIAIDASGNAWIANQGGDAVAEISPAGAQVSGTSGYTNAGLLGAQAIAVDQVGAVWVAGTAANEVLQLSSNGTVAYTLTGNGLSGPAAIAIDTRGYAWVPNFDGGSVTAVTGGLAAGSGLAALGPFTAGGVLANPAGIAVDASNHVWVANSGASTLVELTASGAVSGSFTDGLMIAPYGVAIAPGGAPVAVSPAINALTVLGSGGTAAGFSPAAGAGLGTPTALGVDGAGVVWMANTVAGTVSGISASTGAAYASVGLGTVSTPEGIAVDMAGDVWVTGAGDNSVTEFVGLGSPVVCPVVSSH